MQTLTQVRQGIGRGRLRWFAVAALLVLLMVTASTVLAQDGTPPDTEAIASTANDTALSLNVLWVLVAAALVFFMQAGFALVETGFTQAKNVAHTMMMNVMVFCIGAVGYWLTGFAIEFGGVNYVYAALSDALPAWAFSPVTLGAWTTTGGAALLDKPLLIGGSGFMGLTGFMLGGLGANAGVLVFFIFQMVFMDTAATIPTGTMAERLKFVGFALMGLWVSMFIYPLIGNWVWGGGWLANLGRTLAWGNGAVDFAGSGVVHTVGGSVALAGALIIGPRLGRFNRNGTANAIPAHNIPMGALGTIILFFGWFGFNAGSALGFTGAFRNLAVMAAINTLMAGAVGGVVAMLYMWLISPAKKPDPGMSMNGMLAGLVAITAPCAFVDTTGAVIIGAIAGVLVCVATVGLERLRIDDAVGAIPVHFVNGIWGVLAVGLFANGNPDTSWWNGVAAPVTGLFYGGGAGQLLAQLAEGLAVALTATVTSLGFFYVLNKFSLLRVSKEVELHGLDLPEMGVEGYPTGAIMTPEALALRTKTPATLAPAAGD